MKNIENFFDKKYSNNKFNDSIIVSNDKEIILEKYYGYADIEKQIQLDNLTMFDIGSITKGITALVIMQLYEKKQLDLNHTISQYIENFP